MIKTIKVNLEVMESMLYFWQATKDREKVGEAYIMSIADKNEMKEIYEDDFTSESIRLVLSAISNREILNSTNKKERKFWNNNMWMMEDMDYMNLMLAPLKTLNLDSIKDNLKNIDTDAEELEVVFVPGHHDVYKVSKNKLIINFFRVKPDLFDESVITIEDKEIKAFIEEKLKEII